MWIVFTGPALMVLDSTSEEGPGPILRQFLLAWRSSSDGSEVVVHGCGFFARAMCEATSGESKHVFIASTQL